MLTVQTILYPTDLSPCADVALDHAIHVARHFEASLQVLHVVPSFGEDPISGALESASSEAEFLKKLRTRAEQDLKVIAGRIATAGIASRYVISQSRVAGPVILEYAEAEGIDLIVMGTHGRRGVKHLLLGSVAEEVVHGAPCNVLTVREQKGALDEARPVQRILIPIDFGDEAAPLLQVARELAAGYGAHLDVLHVIKPLPFTVTLMTPISVHELVPEIGKKTRARMTDIFENAEGPEVPSVAFHVTEGDPGRMIVDTADEHQADLIVIAPRTLQKMERFFLGSVAERVVRTASCPVFVAKSALLP